MASFHIFQLWRPVAAPQHLLCEFKCKPIEKY